MLVEFLSPPIPATVDGLPVLLVAFDDDRGRYLAAVVDSGEQAWVKPKHATIDCARLLQAHAGRYDDPRAERCVMCGQACVND